MGDRDFNEYTKYLRYFSTRVIQSVVQARMGQPVNHKCNPEPDQNDWFAIKVDEIGEIAAYLRSHVKKFLPAVSFLNVDFFLYLASGEVMPLETWIMSFDPNEKDEESQSQLYFTMSQLLRSVIAAARVTPCYRYYVKDQSADSYVVMYRVYEGKADLSLLGEKYKSIQLGRVMGKYGTIKLDLHYRTVLEINPTAYDENTTEVGETLPSGEVTLFHRHSIAPVPPTRQNKDKLSPCSTGVPTFTTNVQDSPFGSHSSQNKLGRSVSSSESSTTTKSEMKSSRGSPQASSSFPQRNSARRARLRNNSFPFASLLYESQYGDEDRLEKVEEDADNLTNNTNLLNRSPLKGVESKMHTCPSAPPGYIEEVTDNMSMKDNKSSASLEDSKKSDEAPVEQKKEDEMESSDDSYVKVLSFGISDDLGEDLTEYVREMRLAPVNLGSFLQAGSPDIAQQLDTFKERSQHFDDFLARLKENED
jgi:hypothetical protein